MRLIEDAQRAARALRGYSFQQIPLLLVAIMQIEGASEISALRRPEFVGPYL
jgi:hypothetical protein